MRLIDADALETKVKTIYMEFENVAVPARVIPVSDLHLAPTIDAEPMRHGYWIGLEYDGYADGFPVYYLWECSECGNEHKGEDTPDYCSNCGSKMDLEVQEDG